jgi:hypothetical protein
MGNSCIVKAPFRIFEKSLIPEEFFGLRLAWTGPGGPVGTERISGPGKGRTGHASIPVLSGVGGNGRASLLDPLQVTEARWVRDRVMQIATLRILEPIFDKADFLDWSYGFRRIRR